MDLERSKQCINCGEELSGKYCSSCGLKQVTSEDKKIKHFFEELFTSLFFADGKILSTLRVIFTKPGELSRTYISGNRKKYIAPLQLFLFVNLIYFLLPSVSIFNTSLSAQIKSQPYSSIVKEAVRNEIQRTGGSYEDYRARYESKSTENGKLLLVIIVILQAAALQLLFMKNKKFYFTDFIAVSAYFNSIYILVLLILLPSLVLFIDTLVPINTKYINETVLSVALLLILATYLFAFLKNAFQITTLSSIVRSFAIALFLIPSFMIYRFALFWTTYWTI